MTDKERKEIKQLYERMEAESKAMKVTAPKKKAKKK